MKKNQLNGRLDVEWMLLMEQARALGLTKAEVELFLKATCKKSQDKPISMIFLK